MRSVEASNHNEENQKNGDLYTRITAAIAAAPPRTNEAALALAAPVYLATGPDPVAEAPLTGVDVAAPQLFQSPLAAASGVLVAMLEVLYE